MPFFKFGTLLEIIQKKYRFCFCNNIQLIFFYIIIMCTQIKHFFVVVRFRERRFAGPYSTPFLGYVPESLRYHSRLVLWLFNTTAAAAGTNDSFSSKTRYTEPIIVHTRLNTRARTHILNFRKMPILNVQSVHRDGLALDVFFPVWFLYFFMSYAECYVCKWNVFLGIITRQEVLWNLVRILLYIYMYTVTARTHARVMRV